MDALEELCELAGDEVRGAASRDEVATLESDLDGWAAALRALDAKIDDQIAVRAAGRVEDGAHHRMTLDRYRDEAAWELRARTFQRGVRARLHEVDLRRARQAHQQLRRIVSRLHADLIDGVPRDDDVDALAEILDALDEADPVVPEEVPGAA